MRAFLLATATVLWLGTAPLVTGLIGHIFDHVCRGPVIRVAYAVRLRPENTRSRFLSLRQACTASL